MAVKFYRLSTKIAPATNGTSILIPVTDEKGEYHTLEIMIIDGQSADQLINIINKCVSPGTNQGRLDSHAPHTVPQSEIYGNPHASE